MTIMDYLLIIIMGLIIITIATTIHDKLIRHCRAYRTWVERAIGMEN